MASNFPVSWDVNELLLTDCFFSFPFLAIPARMMGCLPFIVVIPNSSLYFGHDSPIPDALGHLLVRKKKKTSLFDLNHGGSYSNPHVDFYFFVCHGMGGRAFVA